MHALGFWHEQQRYDRDSYVTIVTSNVGSSNLYNFDIYGPNQISTFNIPYEYGSNMHYGAYDFASNPNQEVIITTDPNYQYTLGVNYFPSFLDIFFINTLYGFTSKYFGISRIMFFFEAPVHRRLSYANTVAIRIHSIVRFVGVHLALLEPLVINCNSLHMAHAMEWFSMELPQIRHSLDMRAIQYRVVQQTFTIAIIKLW